ncbi:hypothetical protein [Kitasatospora sp. NPDC005856]|uniref:hypothetical protein n=1 Tax=Kitasatospora sp. NPDC005856 TaxID=3154566 RepID=UPI0033C72822
MAEFKKRLTALVRKSRTPPVIGRGNQVWLFLVRLTQFTAALATITDHHHW